MYIIYVITNNINDKVYVGQTKNTIECRFAQHKNKALHSEWTNRPLYSAMIKYGVHNFTIQQIDFANNKKEANAKEKKYILKYDSYKNGYNATLGGDTGDSLKKSVLQIDIHTLQILNRFSSTHEAGDYLGKHNTKISNACTGKQISAYGYYWCYEDQYKTFKPKHRKYSKPPKIVIQRTLDGKYVNKYHSTIEAAKAVNGSGPHLSRACRGERKQYLGYLWSYE